MGPRVPNPAAFAAVGVLLALAAAPAWADPAAGVQAPTDAGPVATATHDDTQAKIASWLADSASNAGEDEVGGCPAAALPDGKIHGEVGAAIGSGGYRSAYGVVNIPLGKQGDEGEVTLAVSQSRGRGWYGREAFGGPYGYGPGPFGAPELAMAPAWRSRSPLCDGRLAQACLADARDPCGPLPR